MLYGLNFSSDTGDVIQVNLDVSDCAVIARASVNGGEWSPLRRLDVRRFGDGTLDETVNSTVNAQRADKADRLSQPVKITFTGDVSGTLEFDGSQQGMTCNISIPTVPSVIQSAINNAVSNIGGGGWGYYDGGSG
jgi:hypothetical protein